MRCHKLIFVAALVLSVGSLSLGSSQNSGLSRPHESVILIRSVKQDFNYVTPWKRAPLSRISGSGFVVAGNRILTNAHNVSNSRYVELRKENVASRYVARVVFVGHDCDLAMLTVDDPSFFEGTRALELAGIPKVNSTVSTYGFPVGGNRISVTEGVVSRIEMDTYVHSGADKHLAIQTDAAINPGNSGGPVIQDGKVVGVAFQGLTGAENIGYMIPTTVIRHFLEDVEDGKYDAFGSMGTIFYPGLHNPSYRDYLKVPPGEDGVVVLNTVMHSSLESILEPADVMTRIDEYNIDNDGTVNMHGLRLSISEVVESKQIGEKAELTFYRQGKRMTATATIALNRPVLERARQYDRPPPYVCFAGLVFVPATRNFLETWGRQWPRDIPFYLRYLFAHSMTLNEDRDRKEYVVLSAIMPDEINSYADPFKSQVVDSINGVKIHSLSDVQKAFEKTSERFYEITFMGNKRILPIEAEKARLRNESILQKYDIPAAARLETNQ
ncbi:MAG: S1C family serine protease [Planctomycetota bacterium]